MLEADTSSGAARRRLSVAILLSIKAPTRPPANKAAGGRLDTKSPARGAAGRRMHTRRRIFCGDDGIDFPCPPCT